MPLIRFDAIAEGPAHHDATPAVSMLVRFLTSGPAYPELVSEVIWHDLPSQTNDRVYANIRGLKPQEDFVSGDDPRSPFEVLQEALRLFNAMVTDASELLDSDDWNRGTVDQLLESLTPVSSDEEPDISDLILMIRGSREFVEETLELAASFNSRRDRDAVQLMMVENHDGMDPAYLLRVQGTGSTYPVLVWLAAPEICLFARFCDGGYVAWGFRHPVAEISSLHTSLLVPRANNNSLSLIGPPGDQGTGWTRIEDDRQFHSLPHIADISLAPYRKSDLLKSVSKDELQAEKLRVTLNLASRVQGSSNTFPASSEGASSLYHGQSLKDRIRSLDLQKSRIDRELSHLRDLEQAHFLCVFEDTSKEAILNFLSDYPLSRIRNFLYLPCDSISENRLHILISREGASRSDLPGEIAHHGDLYVRDPAWHGIGVDVYLPEGYEIRPFIGFENTVELLHAFEPDIAPESLNGKSFILRPDGEDTVTKLILPHEEATELTESLQYINANMRTSQLTSIADSILEAQDVQFQSQYNDAVRHLDTTRERLKNQFTIYLEGMDEDLNAALDELAHRKTEMDEYTTARKTMTDYCRSVRDLVQHPGSEIFDFLRKETELNRTLANQIASIDYRFSLQFESFEHQSKQILHRDHEVLKSQLQDLVSKIEMDGKSLQEHTEAIRHDIANLKDVPDRITHGLENLKQLQESVKSYLDETRRIVG